MEFTVKAGALRGELALLERVTPRRPAIPALVNARVDAADGVLGLVATDARVGVQTRLSVAMEHGGEALIPVGRLSDLLNTLGGLDVRLEAKDGAVKVEAGGYRGTLHALPVEDYPATPQPDEDSLPFQLPVATLRTLIKRTRFAVASHEDPRAQIMGARLEIRTDGSIHMVGTDGHRLAWAYAPIEAHAAASAILSPLMLDALAPILEDAEGTADIDLIDRHGFITVGRRRVFGQLVDGLFPAWTRMIAQHPYRAVIARAPLTDALRRARMTAESARVVMNFSPLGLEIASSASVGEATERLPLGDQGVVAYDGPEVQVGVSAGYVMDWLAVAGVDQVAVGLKDNTSSLVWTAADGNVEALCLIMPMTV